eukprot:4212029-Pleurochrysis_carterae.AAC.1
MQTWQLVPREPCYKSRICCWRGCWVVRSLVQASSLARNGQANDFEEDTIRTAAPQDAVSWCVSCARCFACGLCLCVRLREAHQRRVDVGVDLAREGRGRLRGI